MWQWVLTQLSKAIGLPTYNLHHTHPEVLRHGTVGSQKDTRCSLADIDKIHSIHLGTEVTSKWNRTQDRRRSRNSVETRADQQWIVTLEKIRIVDFLRVIDDFRHKRVVRAMPKFQILEDLEVEWKSWRLSFDWQSRRASFLWWRESVGNRLVCAWTSLTWCASILSFCVRRR
jgi:hypothetical protein